WMCCDPLPPVPLGNKLLMTIGRSDASDLTLPHKEVSRRHAVVKVLGKTMVIEDEGSSNGSYLNGKRVSSSLLKVGDKITIGPYDVDIRSTDDMVEHDQESSTKSMELTSVSRINPAASLTGLLDEVPAAELLQQLEFNKKTGTLDIHHSDSHGQLVVANGLPVWATYEELTDDEAVIAMAQLTRGRFSFSANVEPGDKTMRSRITGLLFEASRRMDEGAINPRAETTLASSPIGEALANLGEEGEVANPNADAKTEAWTAAEAAAHGIDLGRRQADVDGFSGGSEDTDVAEVPAFDDVEHSDEAEVDADLTPSPDESDHDWDLTSR
ncbi:MAG: FHA domain-containing protein, partial [Planctomycetes bacterium]|nr:FHA domain-containing protein [Planctomycetota bacterium]